MKVAIIFSTQKSYIDVYVQIFFPLICYIKRDLFLPKSRFKDTDLHSIVSSHELRISEYGCISEVVVYQELRHVATSARSEMVSIERIIFAITIH